MPPFPGFRGMKEKDYARSSAPQVAPARMGAAGSGYEAWSEIDDAAVHASRRTAACGSKAGRTLDG